MLPLLFGPASEPQTNIANGVETLGSLDVGRDFRESGGAEFFGSADDNLNVRTESIVVSKEGLNGFL
jgi:hypothetical protein